MLRVEAGGMRRGLEMLLSTGWKPGKKSKSDSNILQLCLFIANLILVQFKDLISGVDDPALNPTDCTDRG